MPKLGNNSHFGTALGLQWLSIEWKHNLPLSLLPLCEPHSRLWCNYHSCSSRNLPNALINGTEVTSRHYDSHSPLCSWKILGWFRPPNLDHGNCSHKSLFGALLPVAQAYPTPHGGCSFLASCITMTAFHFGSKCLVFMTFCHHL